MEESDLSWLKKQLMIWISIHIEIPEQTTFLEETKENSLWQWQSSVTHQSFSWTSHQQVLILRPKDSCGILFQRSQPKERRALSLSPLTPWMKLKLSAPKSESWLKENSNVLDLLSTSRTNLELVMKWKSRSRLFLKLNPKRCSHHVVSKTQES